MGQLAAIGAEPLIRGFALAGVRLLAAADSDEVRAAWRDLPAGVDVVILTAAAAQLLGDATGPAAGRPLVAVLP